MDKIRPENLAAYMKRGKGKEIADACGVTTATVSGWKHGGRPVPDDHVETVCRILGVTLDELTSQMSPSFGAESQDLEEILLRREAADVLPGERLAVIDLLRSWKSKNRKNHN